MDDKMLKELQAWILTNYDKDALYYDSYRSEGDYGDVFDDGYFCGESWATVKVAEIIGMNLTEKQANYNYEKKESIL